MPDQCATHKFLQVTVAANVSGIEEHLWHGAASRSLPDSLALGREGFQVHVRVGDPQLVQRALRPLAMWTPGNAIDDHPPFNVHLDGCGLRQLGSTRLVDTEWAEGGKSPHPYL